MIEKQEGQQCEEPASSGSEEQGASDAVAPAGSEPAGTSPQACPVPMWSSEPCGRPIHHAPDHDVTPVCLMHSRDPEKGVTFQKEFEAILKAAGRRRRTLYCICVSLCELRRPRIHCTLFLLQVCFRGGRQLRPRHISNSMLTSALRIREESNIQQRHVRTRRKLLQCNTYWLRLLRPHCFQTGRRF